MTKLGERLEAERARLDITLTEFADDVLGIDQSLVSRYINRGQLPGRKNARKIAARLGLTSAEMEELLTPEPNSTPEGDTLEVVLERALVLARAARAPADEEGARQLLIDRLRSDREVETLMLKEMGREPTLEELISLVRFALKVRAGAPGDE